MSSFRQELQQNNRQLLSSFDVYSLLKEMARATKEKFAEDELDHHSTTALVHEVYLKLSQNNSQLLSDKHKELIKQLSQAVRCVVIDLLRKKSAQQRAGDGFSTGAGLGPEELLKIDAIIEQMSQEYPTQAQAAVLHHFNGMEEAHIAQVLDLSLSTIYNYLNFFKRYVRVKLA